MKAYKNQFHAKTVFPATIASKIAPGINATCTDTNEREILVKSTPIRTRMKPTSLSGEIREEKENI